MKSLFVPSTAVRVFECLVQHLVLAVEGCPSCWLVVRSVDLPLLRFVIS